jgi:hypothetical protein
VEKNKGFFKVFYSNKQEYSFFIIISQQGYLFNKNKYLNNYSTNLYHTSERTIFCLDRILSFILTSCYFFELFEDKIEFSFSLINIIFYFKNFKQKNKKKKINYFH